MALAAPPRDVRRRQERYGTVGAERRLPQSGEGLAGRKRDAFDQGCYSISTIFSYVFFSVAVCSFQNFGCFSFWLLGSNMTRCEQKDTQKRKIAVGDFCIPWTSLDFVKYDVSDSKSVRRESYHVQPTSEPAPKKARAFCAFVFFSWILFRIPFLFRVLSA